MATLMLTGSPQSVSSKGQRQIYEARVSSLLSASQIIRNPRLSPSRAATIENEGVRSVTSWIRPHSRPCTAQLDVSLPWRLPPENTTGDGVRLAQYDLRRLAVSATDKCRRNRRDTRSGSQIGTTRNNRTSQQAAPSATLQPNTRHVASNRDRRLTPLRGTRDGACSARLLWRRYSESHRRYVTFMLLSKAVIPQWTVFA